MTYELYKLINGEPTRFENPTNLTGDRTALATEQGYKPKKVEYVDEVVDKYEETDEYLICYIKNPKEIDEKTLNEMNFNSQQAKNELFGLYITNMPKLNSFSAMVMEFLNNHTSVAFQGLKIYLATMVVDENMDINQDDYDNIAFILLNQSINLEDY